MVLLVKGTPVAASELLGHEEVQAAAATFLRQSVDIPLGDKIIYACQGEEATCSAGEAAWLASSDATTCIIAVVAAAPDLASSAQAAGEAAAAPRGTSTAGTVRSGLARVVHHDEGTPAGATLAGLGCCAVRLWLAGAYEDAGGMGRAAAARLLRCLERSSARLHVKLACLGVLNTAADGSPLSTSLAVDLRSLAARPAAPHPPHRRGPLLPPRMAQWAFTTAHSGSGDGAVGAEGNEGNEDIEDRGRRPLRSVYDAAAQRMELALWRGRPAPHALWYAGRMLQLPDALLLHRCSTSPAHEPPHFVAVLSADMRAAYSWLLEQSGPEELATHRFAWTPDGWQAVAEDKAPAAARLGGQALGGQAAGRGG